MRRIFKYIISISLAVGIIFPMTIIDSQAKNITKISDIKITDKPSGKNNTVTVKWNQVSGADGYEVTVKDKGAFNKKNIYKTVSGAKEKDIYHGNKTSINVQLKRHHEYQFKVRGVFGQEYSDWTEKYYYTALDNSKSAHESAVWVNDDMRRKKNTTVKNNVIRLKKNVTTNIPVFLMSKGQVVIDLAGHKLNLRSEKNTPAKKTAMMRFGCDYDNSCLIINDSVGGGSFNTAPGYLLSINVDNLVVNDGRFGQKMEVIPFPENSHASTIINSGIFKNTVSSYENKLTIAGGTFDKKVEGKGTKTTINGGTFKDELYTYADMVIRNGVFNKEVDGRGQKITINGGTFNDELYTDAEDIAIENGVFNKEVCCDGSKTTINGGKFKDYISLYGATTTINGGAYHCINEDGYTSGPFRDGKSVTINKAEIISAKSIDMEDNDYSWITTGRKLKIAGKITWNPTMTILKIG